MNRRVWLLVAGFALGAIAFALAPPSGRRLPLQEPPAPSYGAPPSPREPHATQRSKLRVNPGDPRDAGAPVDEPGGSLGE